MHAFAARQSSSPLSLLDPNRGDALGAGLSAVLPLAALIMANGLASAAGVDAVATAREGLPFAVPHWVASVITLMILPTWGMARWLAWQSGAKGRAASHWVVALIAGGVLHQLAAPHLDLFFTIAADAALLLLALATAAHLFGASRAAFFWLLPSLGWLGLTGVVGFTVLAGGWAPPFAVTDQGAPVAAA